MNKTLALITAFGICLLSGLSDSQNGLAQERSESDYISSSLKPLVGKKIKVVTLEGEQVKGTFWDFDEQFIFVKVKKGLVYSRTEKLQLSDVDYIEDPNGTKISMLELEALSAIEAAKQNKLDSGNKSTLYFHTDDILDSKNDLSLAQTEGEETTQTRRSSKSSRQTFSKKKSTPKRSPSVRSRRTSSKPTGSKLAKSRTEARTSRTVAAKSKSSRGKSTTAPKKTAKTLVAKDDDIQVSEGMADQSSSSTETEAVPLPRPLRARPSTSAGFEAASGGLKKLRYQNLILFAVILVAFGFLVIAKVKEANSSAYGKASMFPAEIVKLNGRFGLIDQGTLDGIKLGDVIKLYRKEGRHIDFKGKAYVRKVADKFSLVEAVKTRKFTVLELGDSGFVDRSFSANIVRGLRKAVGAVLDGLARGLGRAAKNLEGQIQSAQVEKVVPQPPAPQPENREPRVVAPTRPKVVPTPQPRKQSRMVAPHPNSSSPRPNEKIGFGLDDL